MYLLTVLPSPCDSYCLVFTSNRFQMWEINEMHCIENYVAKNDHRPVSNSVLISDLC